MSRTVDRLLTAAGVLATSARIQIAEMRSSTIVIVFTFVQPAALLAVTLLPMDGRTPQRVAGVVFGVLLTAFWTATVWGAASVLRRDRAMGTLARSMTGVVDARLVVVGKGLGSSLVTVVLVGVTIALVLLVMRQPVALAHPVWLVVGMLTVLASGAAVGLLVGSIFVLTRYGPQVSSVLMYPVFLLGGMLIPPEVLPAAVRWVSYGISMRWLQQFLVGAAAGHVSLPALGAAIALTVAYAVAGAAMFSRFVARARRDATLDVF
ncbi:MAG TPA: ABC transporter permease [Pseudonocardiaceae bacterium]|nr:ABC transporter permease [Pseudonocardiaceae bacterium]